jgi:multiple sugar transport system ATP-binding protein
VPRYEVRNLTRRFGKVTALDSVSFVAERGEFIVVLGPTGAGKTTLLRTIAGLEKPDAGQILEDTRDITAAAPAERDMAMVFQNFSLYPRLTVYDNLAFPLRPKWRQTPKEEIDRRVRWAADLLGITQKLAQKPTTLSGGQQQRVAIGRAIVREPRLFLFDEPLASLDAKLREQMAIEIHRMQRRLDVTMLYVTHDQIEAMSLADRIVVLDHGKVLQIGTPDEIYSRPANPRVARMLGSPPINLFTADEAAALGLPRAATVGVRPEHVRVSPAAGATNGNAAKVLVSEHLGPCTVLLLDIKGIQVRAVSGPNDEVKPGETVEAHMGAERALVW